MNAVIEDPMGLETGVRIDMVKTVMDRKEDRIVIHGRMAACTRAPALQDVEPEVECAIMDENGSVAGIALSRHNGCFWTNRQALWSIEIEDVDENILWDEISMLHLRLIYCKSRSGGRTDERTQTSEPRGLRLNYEQ
jgi:hypothetical protein